MTHADTCSEVVELLRSGTRFLITTHLNPDGDGIGSMLALADALDQMGKHCVLHMQDPVPRSLAFLPGSERISTAAPAGDFDAAIMVDCSEPKRAGDAFAACAASLSRVVIDHHLYPHLEGAVACIDEHAASAGEVVWHVLEKLGVERNTDIALCIYTTLVIDTGFFRYSNTTKDVLSLAAELVAVGAEPWLVARNLDESYPAPRLRLLAKALDTLELGSGGRYASIEVTNAMLAETGASLIDSDEFAPYPRSIDSVEVSALFREKPDGTVKVSMRSKNVVNVAAIARRHGGGGHIRAAGFSLNMNIADAKRMVAEEVKSALMSS